MKSPYDIIKKRYLTEKTAVLENLKNATSNKAVARCENPKYAFVVDAKANKHQIAEAVECAYKEKNVRVVAVNTIIVKPKVQNKRGKMQAGVKSGFKKAIVTLSVGHSLD
jgi:large subunit ribosomal protein L23